MLCWPIEGTRSPRTQTLRALFSTYNHCSCFKSSHATFYQAHFQNHFAEILILFMSLYTTQQTRFLLLRVLTLILSPFFKNAFSLTHLTHYGRCIDTKTSVALNNFYHLSNFALTWGPSNNPENYVTKPMKSNG